MAAWSACNRAIKRQLFRKNETFLIVLIIAMFLFMITIYQNTSCDRSDELLSETDANFVRVTRNTEDTSSDKGKERTFLFTMVLAAPGGKERRDALRKTWLSDIPSFDMAVTVKFIIGTGALNEEDKKRLEDENKIYKDILLLPEVEDGYNQLTNKVLQTFKWIDKNVNSSYVLKVDDDSFVRLEVIVRELKSASAEKFYWGFFRGNSRVKSAGSWTESNWILCDRYLPYALGGGYILSSDLVHYIARNSDMLQLFHSEDVSVGTWLAPVKVSRTHDYRFDTEYMSRGCNNAHIVSHKQSVNDMIQKHNHLRETGKLCSQEFQLRKSFIYDWKVPPSQCCKRMNGIP